MPAHRDTPDTVELQPPSVQACPHSKLWELKAVEAVVALEARISDLLLALLHTTIESLIGLIHLLDDALRGLAKHLSGIREGIAVVLCQRPGLGLGDAAAFELVGMAAFSE